MYTFLDLSDRFPIQIDIKRLQSELARLEEENWLSHYDKALADGWTTIPLYSHDGSSDNADSQRVGRWGAYKQTPYLEKLPYFRQIVEAFDCPCGRIRIMKLMPGSVIKGHRDTFDEVSDYSFGQVRLHIPIVTNDKVLFTVSGKPIHMKEGRLYYVNFSKTHYVRNDGDEPRTHLVMDLKVNDSLRKVFPPITPIQTLDMWAVRTFLPIFLWIPLKARRSMNTAFWRHYNGSMLQKLRFRLSPKARGQQSV